MQRPAPPCARRWAPAWLDPGHRAAAIARASPTRILVSGVARLEVHQPIPPPGGRSPDGLHTHLLPGHLAQGLARPPGLALPDGLFCGLSLDAAAGGQ